VNYVDFALSYDDIVNTPRIHLENDHLDIEPGFSEEEVSKLRLPRGVELFHWREKNMYFGGVHAVFKDIKGQLEGAGDRRRAGQVIKVY
jgi:gamma-glutamyltranspeptidase/glutathione hydrolase